MFVLFFVMFLFAMITFLVGAEEREVRDGSGRRSGAI